MFRPFLLLAAFLPASPALADIPYDDADAVALFTAGFAERCSWAFDEDGALSGEPDRFDVTGPNSWSDEGSPAVIWEFGCEIYAYNTAQVFILATEDGIGPVALARPSLKIVYDEAAAAPGEADSVIETLEIDGWTADLTPINARFDPATVTITAHTYWRGLGDASDTGSWRLRDQQFHLIRYDVDASYDGEVNPVTLVEFE